MTNMEEFETTLINNIDYLHQNQLAHEERINELEKKLLEKNLK